MVVSTGHLSQVSIELCGEVRLEVDGRRRERELPGRLGRVLLAYLALNRHRAVTRDELIEALWPNGAPGDPGGHAQHAALGRAALLGADLLRGRGELRLVLPADAQLDVETAAARVERSRAALGAGDAGAAAAEAEAALDVLERGLLRGVDVPWLDAFRRELEDERLDALELLARAGLAAGEAGIRRSHWASRQIISLAPFRESGYALLMEAQAAQGNVGRGAARPTSALRAADARRARRDAVARAAGGAPAAARADGDAPARRGAGAAAARGAGARRAPGVWSGGPAPSRCCARRLAAAAAGERRFVLLAGEPGIGKTSLAAAIAREAHERGDAVVLYGRSDEDALAPYQPFAEMIGHCFSHGPVEELAGELRLELEELGRLVPAARRWLPAARVPPSGLPDVERYRLFEAVVAVLSRLARRGTPVLICDDLQWADPPTLRLLRHLARAATPERLLFVGTYRDVEVSPDAPLAGVIADLRREQSLDVVALAGLDLDETVRLTDLHGDPARRLRELTGGNPLFLGEMLRVLADAGDPGRALDELVVPEGVSEVVVRRVARLGEEAEEILTLAAVAGQAFRAALLERAAEAPRDAVVDVLDRAVAAGLLATTDDPDRLTFSHALIRETLYDAPERRAARAAAPPRRRDARGAPRRAASRRGRAGPPLLPGAPSRRRRARDPLRPRGGRPRGGVARLGGRGAPAGARAGRRAAARALRRGGPRPSCCSRSARRSPAPATRPRGPRSRRPRRSRAGRAPEQLARAAIGYGGRYYEAGVIDPKLIELLREALDSVRPEEGELRSRLVARLAEILHFAGDPEASLRLSGEAVARADAAGRRRGPGGGARGAPRLAAARRAPRRAARRRAAGCWSWPTRPATRSARCRRCRRGSSTCSASATCAAPGRTSSGWTRWRASCASRCSRTSSSAGAARSPSWRAGSRRRSGWRFESYELRRALEHAGRRERAPCPDVHDPPRAGAGGGAAAGGAGGGRAVPGARRLARGAAARPPRGGRRAAGPAPSTTGPSPGSTRSRATSSGWRR